MIRVHGKQLRPTAPWLKASNSQKECPEARMNGVGTVPSVPDSLCYLHHPRRAASILATSIFFIGIIASKARFASLPPAASASVSTRGVICQERPQRSLHQPHWLSLPPLPTIAFQ